MEAAKDADAVVFMTVSLSQAEDVLFEQGVIQSR
jgi:3-hydroxyisobutyrate dehydrogenase-like beta-hydroxyacid dehydrogenase